MATGEQDIRRQQRMEQGRKWAETRLATLQAQGFYGRVSLHVEDGIIKKVTEERTFIPPS